MVVCAKERARSVFGAFQPRLAKEGLTVSGPGQFIRDLISKPARRGPASRRSRLVASSEANAKIFPEETTFAA
jgi:hypothetical protein